MAGGMFVGSVTGFFSALTINYYFLTPVHSLSVARTDQAISLLVFVGMAVLISGAVEIAVSRAKLARATVRQAETISALAQTEIGGNQSVEDVLERGRTAFGMESVVLKERDPDTGDWVDINQVGWAPADKSAALRFDIPMGTTRRLVGRGPELFASDKRALQTFADAVATVRAGSRLSEKAQLAEDLATVDKQRTALLAAVGHDLRTPLSGIRMAAETLGNPNVELSLPQRTQLLESIGDSTDVLDRLLANLLDASRLQAGGVVASLEPVALDGVVAAAVMSIPGASSRVDVQVDDDFPFILADRGLLERVIFNLVDNAIKHGGEQSDVVITALATQESARIEVRDTGPGVPEELREKIFEPFSSAGDRSKAGGGLGLGLSVARGFLEAMNGALTAEQVSGGGLVMRLRVPLARR
jgi:two-component system sensor histidine kinase KdpD